MASTQLEIRKGKAPGGLCVRLVADRATRDLKDSYDLASATVTLRLPSAYPEQDDLCRRAAGKLANYIRTLACGSVHVQAVGITRHRVWEFVEGLAIALVGGEWSRKTKLTTRRVVLYVPSRLWDAGAWDRIQALREALEGSRWLVTAPPNEQGPEQLALQTQSLMQDVPGVTVTTYGDGWLQAERFHLLRAVAAAGRPPVLIHAHYKPANRRTRRPRIVLVGKGVTFDSGGLDIKPAASMLEMKRDMAGAAAVMAVLRYAARRRLPLEIHALAPAVENLVDAQAMRPSDVYVARNGLTVEITNTDAEGRLILADTLAWAGQMLQPDITVDLATLTGAATMVAGWHTVVVGKDTPTKTQILDAAMRSGERAIGLPLWAEYDRELRSDIADWKNSSNTRNAGTISGGAFLAKFAPDNWQHLDIAANAWTSSRRDYLPLGATGAGVRTLAYWLESLVAR